ncbi:hypothetical protein FHX74_000765 [Friedmanniella endophytica]|uniref:N-acetyltransferase domain-containing protein n=1 Tax=Microlunatus kandeliicorticis TaxID=1759536 RepID=A0A7W3P4Q9_9ACTN|nr:hypothetical protein [Microlunatus kandeliicorticis]MBA8793171.1 hypothetical protein [Microlunatus kandeliicorticis]
MTTEVEERGRARIPDDARALDHWVFGPLTVTAHDTLEPVYEESYWRLYEGAFGPLRTEAAARQVLDRDEFSEEMTDPRVTKYLVWDDDGAAGMTTLTQDLSTVPWISPHFYAARYPDHAARDAIFYLGFILVRPGLRSSRVFHRLMDVVTDRISAADGVVGYDICAFNITTLNFADRIETVVGRRHPAAFAEVDSQHYFTTDFLVAGPPAD